MRVTIDLEREIIIIPDNFFKKIAEDNARLERFGADPCFGCRPYQKCF